MTPEQSGHSAPRLVTPRPIRSKRRSGAVITRAKQTQSRDTENGDKALFKKCLRRDRPSSAPEKTNPIKPNWRSHPERNEVESNGPRARPDRSPVDLPGAPATSAGSHGRTPARQVSCRPTGNKTAANRVGKDRP